MPNNGHPIVGPIVGFCTQYPIVGSANPAEGSLFGPRKTLVFGFKPNVLSTLHPVNFNCVRIDSQENSLGRDELLSHIATASL